MGRRRLRRLLAGVTTLLLAMAGMFAFSAGAANAATTVLPYPSTVFQD
jgi:hypothetical protein